VSSPEVLSPDDYLEVLLPCAGEDTKADLGMNLIAIYEALTKNVMIKMASQILDCEELLKPEPFSQTPDKLAISPRRPDIAGKIKMHDSAP
jgi:hypothetical protein